MSRHPSTKWAQRSDKVYLTIELPDAKDVKLNLKPAGHFDFSANGADEMPYELDLELFDAVNVEESKAAVAPRTIYYLVKKAESKWWPRLLKKEGKPPVFLKVDWDKWQDEEDEDIGLDDFGGMDFSKLDMGGVDDDDMEDDEEDMALSSSIQGANSAAVAITTTDLVSKSIAVQAEIGGVPIRIGGMAKGSGMIHPNMATMLGILTTDAQVSNDVWREMVRTSVSRSFNQITVDGDTSTNDCVIAMASGLSGLSGTLTHDSTEARQFQACLDAVMQGLAKSVAWDGEGATCLIEVTVTGANNETEAAKIARSVASSSLVKAAVFGRDPNWGRIACSVGYSGIRFDADQLDISLGAIRLMKSGQPLPFDRSAASKYLKDAGDVHGTVNIDISIGSGAGTGKAWGCDLSYKYVEINAEYTT